MFTQTNEVFILAQKKNSFEVLKLKLDRSTKANMVELFNNSLRDFEARTDKIQYQIDYKLEEDEVFFIENYNLLDQIKSAIDSPDLIDNYRPNITTGFTESGKEVKAIFIAKKDGDQYIVSFQKFEKRQIVKKTHDVLFFDNETFREMTQFAITLGSSVSCYYDGKDLLFFEYKDANRVFDLSEYYRIATQDEVNRFKDCEKFVIEDVDSYNKLTNSATIRKKIAQIIDSDILNSYTASQLKTKADDLNVPIILSADNEKIRIPTESKDLKKVLAFLCERIYKGVLTGNKYYTNSTRIES